MKGLVYRDPRAPKGSRLTFAPWLNALRKSSGAYVIRDKATHETLYVGESHTGNLAKTIKRHFYSWSDSPERPHNVYRLRQVEIAVRTTPPNASVGAQDNLIVRLGPRDNIQGQEAPF